MSDGVSRVGGLDHRWSKKTFTGVTGLRDLQQEKGGATSAFLISANEALSRAFADDLATADDIEIPDALTKPFLKRFGGKP